MLLLVFLMLLLGFLIPLVMNMFKRLKLNLSIWSDLGQLSAYFRGVVIILLSRLSCPVLSGW